MPTQTTRKPVFTFMVVGKYAGEWKPVARCTSEEQAATAMSDVAAYRKQMGMPALEMMVV